MSDPVKGPAERARRKAYYAANREKAIAKAKAWHKALRISNPELVRERTRIQNKKNYWKFKPHIKFRETKTAKYLWNLAKRRANRSGVEFSLSVEDIVVPTQCPLLGIPIDIKTPNQDFHPSLDRLDNTKGYIKGNVAVVSFRANRIKADATTEELRRLAANIDRLMGR